VHTAKAYVTAAIGAAHQLTVGHGHGPTHHFHTLWQD
jgi:hydroxymethylpyrimidine/phosphomethylpyrimidine kinase